MNIQKRLFTETLSEWNSDNVPRLGASLAFYTLLSLAPILVIVVAVAAFAYGRQAAEGQLFWEIQDVVGAERASAVQSLIQSAYKPGTGLSQRCWAYLPWHWRRLPFWWSFAMP